MDVVTTIEEITESMAEEFKFHLANHMSEAKYEGDVNYSLKNYMKLSRSGGYAMFVARVDGELAGYAGYYFSNDPHRIGIMYAVCDLVYVLPAFRGRDIMNCMLAATEEELRKKSIHRIAMSSRPHRDFGPLLTRRGYVRSEIVYVKELG